MALASSQSLSHRPVSRSVEAEKPISTSSPIEEMNGGNVFVPCEASPDAVDSVGLLTSGVKRIVVVNADGPVLVPL